MICPPDKFFFYKNETEKIELVTGPGGKQATFAMTTYEADPKREVFGDAGDQTEEFSDENKSIVWFLVKQVPTTHDKENNTREHPSATYGPCYLSLVLRGIRTFKSQ